MSVQALTFGRLRGFGATERNLLFFSILCGALYFVTEALPPFPGRIVLKACSIAPLAVLAFRLSGGGSGRAGDPAILGVALALSSLGDVLLDLPRWGGFVRGLVAFLLAHIVYIGLFARNFRRPLRPRPLQLLLIGLVLIYSLALSAWFAPSLGPMANPVMIYICTITTMVVCSILAGFSRPWVWIGAILFLISDSIIAVNRFKMHLPMRGYLVWSTYYLGQYGIALGFLRETRGEPSTQ